MKQATKTPNSIREAQELLLLFLSFVAAGSSFWYTINGDINAEYSLYRRLGFFSEVDYYGLLVKAGLAGYVTQDGKRELQILRSVWSDFVDNPEHGLPAHNIEFATKIFDLDAVLLGTKQQDKN